MIRSVLAFTTFIANNPGFIAWLLGGILFSFAAVLGAMWALVGSRLSRLERADDRLTDRISIVERDLEKYMEHVGAGDMQLKRLNDTLDSLSDQLAQISLENVKAHADIINGFSPRLATIESKVERIEQTMPNGELKEMLRLLRDIAER